MLIAVLIPIALFIRKSGVGLKKAGTAAVIVSLLLSSIIILLVRQIVSFNRGYIYNKLISLSASRLSLNYLVLILAGIFLLDATVCVLILIVSRQSRIEADYAIMKQKYEGQTALVEEALRHQETVSRLKHDLTHSFGTVNGLLKQGKIDEAREYVEHKSGALSPYYVNVKTNNEYVNALIAYESARASEKGIDVSVYTVSNIDFPDNDDLVSLIGNMFDNAINAASECDNTKMIRLNIDRDKEAFRITALNSVKESVMTRNPRLLTTKEDKRAHGYGTKIIREVAEKYYGSADFYDTGDGKFCCTVTLYPEKPF